MNIGVLALVFACVCALVSWVQYPAEKEKAPQEPRVFDYAAVLPKEVWE